MITNKEYFGNETLNAALDKYNKDLADGYDTDWSAWLDSAYIDFTMGKMVRGTFYTYEGIEEKIRKMEALDVTGYLLEFKNKKGEWRGCEFEPIGGMESNLWRGCLDHSDMEKANDEWYNNDTQVGFFTELGDTWISSSDDWDFRLGVAFDSRTTPTENPKEDGVWEGLTEGGCSTNGEPWRVRKVTVKGTLSNTAKEFFRRNPDVWLSYAKRIEK